VTKKGEKIYHFVIGENCEKWLNIFFLTDERNLNFQIFVVNGEVLPDDDLKTILKLNSSLQMMPNQPCFG
jgi:hypothetical protein